MKMLTALILVSSFAAHATDNFIGQAQAPKILKNPSELSIEGIKFMALKNAAKNCFEAGNKKCAIVSVSSQGQSASAVVRALPIAKEQQVIQVSSGDEVSTEKLSKLELDGLLMKTITKGLDLCKRFQSEACYLESAKFTITNDQYYDLEWNSAAYKSNVEVTLLSIK